MNSRTKFIATLAQELGLTKKASAGLLNTMGTLLKEHLLEEGTAVLPGMGKLKLQARPARAGRNPRTGEQIQIDAKLVVKFKPSSKLF